MEQKKNFTFLEIKQKMVNYCVYQDRCHAEVEQKMKEFILIPEAKEEILLYLIKENYLNEERFAKSYARGKFYIKNWGKNKIKINLLQKGINLKLINKAFLEIDDEDYVKTIKKIIAIIAKKENSENDYQIKQKIVKFLLNKGFEYEIILQILHEKK